MKVGRGQLWRCSLALACMSPWSVLTLAAAEETADEVMSLPPLLVEERLRPLRWRYLQAPWLEVLSLCDDAVTREFVRRAHELDQVLEQLLLPMRFRGTSSVRDIQVLFNEDLSRAKSQEVMEEMLSRDNNEPPAESRLPGTAAGTLPPWQRRRVFFLPNLRLSDMDATAIFAAMRETDPNFAQFTFVADRIRYLLERRVPALPDWFVVGTVRLYEQTQLGPDGITIEPMQWTSEAETRALASDENHPRTLWPMQHLLEVPRPAASAGESELALVWRAQCALFVRWAVAENSGARREALWTLVDRLEHEPLSDESFRSCFGGLSLADVRDQLSDYLPQAVAQRLVLRAAKAGDPAELKPRAATTVEIARIRGEWERMQIGYVKQRFPELMEKYIGQARATLDNAYAAGERDPQLLAIIGLTECDAGNPAGARAYLEAAARASVVRPRVYMELARLRFTDQAAIAGDEGRFSPAQVALILEPLRQARAMQPPLVEALGVLAETLSRATEAPSTEDLSWLSEEVAKFPHASPLVLRAIALNAANGQINAAIALARAGRRAAIDAPNRERFDRALARLTRQ
jgi:hypothetical protein